MSPNKLLYATVGGISALLALAVDQLLWLRFPLYFALGIPLAFLTPFAVAGIGSLVGYWAMEEHGQKFGFAIIVTNLLAAVLGIWWALELQPQAFGARDSTPVFIAGLELLTNSPL